MEDSLNSENGIPENAPNSLNSGFLVLEWIGYFNVENLTKLLLSINS